MIATVPMAKSGKAATIGQLVRKARLAAGLTQVQAAEAVGTVQTYLSQIEGDVKEPSLDMLRKLAQAFGVSPRDLIPE